MKKIFNKKTSIYFLSFIIPIIILVGYMLYNQILTDKDFFINGENYLTADMGGQYNSLYGYIRNVFLGKDSIFYSFHNSLGGNMASTVGYYLASPFNFLYVFVSKSNIPLMTYIIYVLKISLCSLFMTIYISHKFGSRYSNLIFSLTYAFMGFVVAYFFNNMWLDVIYMTPLVMMGIDKLIDGKALLYIITLCMSLIFNFYIAYMLCIFCVIYFFYELFIRYSFKNFKNNSKIILRFVLSSLLAGGLAAFFLVPVFFNMTNSMRTMIDKSMLDVDFGNFPKRLLNTIFSKTLIAGNNRASMLGRLRPVIYISLFSLVLSILYFFNKKIKRKEKLLSLLIVIFFLMSFMMPHLQLFWQAFSLPNGYIDRYSFLFCFFLILLAAKCFYNKNKINIIWFILILIVYCFLTHKLYYLKLPFLEKSDYIVTLVLIFVYLVLSFIYFNVKIKNPKDIILLIFLIVLPELTYNYMGSIILIEESNYGKYYKSSCKLFQNIEDGFYRIDGNYFVTLIDSFACDYYDSTTALSTNNSNLYNFYNKHGGNQTIIGLYIDFDTVPVINSLVGIKYIYNNAKMKETDYELVKRIPVKKSFDFKKNVYLYKNNEALNIGYIISDNFNYNYENEKEDGLYNLNNLLKEMSGINRDVFIRIPKSSTEDSSIYKLHIDRNDEYLYLSTNYEPSMNFSMRYDLHIDNDVIGMVNDGYIGAKKIENEYYNKDINLRFEKFSDYKINDFNLYYFDKGAYLEMIDKLKQHQLENVIIKNNKLYADINLQEDGILFMSIPYDEGWKIYVDGEEVKYNKISNTFIGLNLKAGSHKIYMKFIPKGLTVGIIISLVSLLFVVLYNTSYMKKRMRKTKT